MQYTRLDRYKIKQHMLCCKLKYFRELIALANINQTIFYISLDKHTWRSQTLDALANVLRCNSFSLLPIDHHGAYSDTPLQPSIREEPS